MPLSPFGLLDRWLAPAPAQRRIEWLGEQPYAHRGLHDERRGVIENTETAFLAAIRGRYAIETDIQAAASGEPVIFHDEQLDRLTEADGLVADRSVEELRHVRMRGTSDRILSLGEFLELGDGRAELFLEIKSTGLDADRTLERRVAALLAQYRGPAYVMSFDPRSVAAMGMLTPSVPRGLSAMRFGKVDEFPLTDTQRYRLTHMLDIPVVKPDFLTYEVSDLAVMHRGLRRRYPHLPIITWTVCTPEQRRKADLFADGMIFEGFRP
jgi:glycerophosphoryl diester phosphodiesterase